MATPAERFAAFLACVLLARAATHAGQPVQATLWAALAAAVRQGWSGAGMTETRFWMHACRPDGWPSAAPR